jgi:hypothetical protein
LKVNSPIGSNPLVRGLVALSLTAILAYGSAAAPLAANAEVAPRATEPAAVAAASLVVTLPSSPATMSPLPVPFGAPVIVAPPVRKPVKKLTVRQIIAKTGRERGLSKAEIDALMWICKRESSFHPKSESRNGLYHGLFQLNKGMAHGRPWKDAAWNTRRAIKYMRGRYGSVLRAKAFWVAHHWY